MDVLVFECCYMRMCSLDVLKKQYKASGSMMSASDIVTVFLVSADITLP